MAKNIKKILETAIELAREINEGEKASYIPELEQVPSDLINVAVLGLDGKSYVAGDDINYRFTLQSAAKIVLLIGLLEDVGHDAVFSRVKKEPSGDDFASIARLDQFGPLPHNPMLNSGAIALSELIPGVGEEPLEWLNNWMHKLLGQELHINHKVFASERRTGDRNRALAYLLKGNRVIGADTDIDALLENYFYLCSFEANISEASLVAMILANQGKNLEDMQVISVKTCREVISLMATCGLYNETGTHLVRTGMPAKSGVSGLIIATALGHAGIAVYSPKVNKKGTSMRGEFILEYLSQELGWHFAL